MLSTSDATIQTAGITGGQESRSADFQGFGSGSAWIRVNLNPDPGGQYLPAKIEKSREILCFEALDVLF